MHVWILLIKEKEKLPKATERNAGKKNVYRNISSESKKWQNNNKPRNHKIGLWFKIPGIPVILSQRLIKIFTLTTYYSKIMRIIEVEMKDIINFFLL